MKKIICPSMMCANFENLKNEVFELDNAGADIFHIDVMDGNFVPNFGMGLQDIEVIRASTNKMIDTHLMINNPNKFIPLFAEIGVDIIYVHPESEIQITRTLDLIKKYDKKSGIAINPGTSIHTIIELLNLVDYILVMTVNPGFAGQQYLDFVNNKILDIVKVKQNYSFEIIVDGAISQEKIKQLSTIGVDGFVLGTSALFKKEESYKNIIDKIKM